MLKIASNLESRLKKKQYFDVVFVPHGAYHTREMNNIAKELKSLGISYLFLDITDHYRDEGARTEFKNNNITALAYNPHVFNYIKAKYIFVMNDWSKITKSIINLGRIKNIQSISLVEGVQDYNDAYYFDIGKGSRRYPYTYTDIRFIPGEFSEKYFTNMNYKITGVPRIDALYKNQKKDSPNNLNKVLINANFSYGLYTDIQVDWVTSIINICKELGMEYTISLHHSNPEKFEGYNVSTKSVYEEIEERPILISRFSSVFYEAMAQGLEVVYYNPHKETVETFKEPNGAYPIANSADELKTALSAIKNKEIEYSKTEDYKNFLFSHMYIDPNKSGFKIVADQIKNLI